MEADRGQHDDQTERVHTAASNSNRIFGRSLTSWEPNGLIAARPRSSATSPSDIVATTRLLNLVVWQLRWLDRIVRQEEVLRKRRVELDSLIRHEIRLH